VVASGEERCPGGGAQCGDVELAVLQAHACKPVGRGHAHQAAEGRREGVSDVVEQDQHDVRGTLRRPPHQSGEVRGRLLVGGPDLRVGESVVGARIAPPRSLPCHARPLGAQSSAGTMATAPWRHHPVRSVARRSRQVPCHGGRLVTSAPASASPPVPQDASVGRRGHLIREHRRLDMVSGDPQCPPDPHAMWVWPLGETVSPPPRRLPCESTSPCSERP